MVINEKSASTLESDDSSNHRNNIIGESADSIDSCSVVTAKKSNVTTTRKVS
jgi:hypothetical protein